MFSCLSFNVDYCYKSTWRSMLLCILHSCLVGQDPSEDRQKVRVNWTDQTFEMSSFQLL